MLHKISIDDVGTDWRTYVQRPPKFQQSYEGTRAISIRHCFHPLNHLGRKLRAIGVTVMLSGNGQGIRKRVAKRKDGCLQTLPLHVEAIL